MMGHTLQVSYANRDNCIDSYGSYEGSHKNGSGSTLTGIKSSIGGIASGVGSYVQSTYHDWKENTGRSNMVDQHSTTSDTYGRYGNSSLQNYNRK